MSSEQLRQELEELKERVEALEEKVEDGSTTISRSMDLSTFIQEFGPNSHPERIAAIAYYREAYEREETFTTSDIREGYERARFQRPSNLSDSIAGAENKGWVHRKGKDGQATVRQLTNKGVEMVEEVMNDGA
jgi:uncharacterized coiled-coil DUF342 family protein